MYRTYNMGVSLEVYRSRIGAYRHRCPRQFKRTKENMVQLKMSAPDQHWRNMRSSLLVLYICMVYAVMIFEVYYSERSTIPETQSPVTVLPVEGNIDASHVHDWECFRSREVWQSSTVAPAEGLGNLCRQVTITGLLRLLSSGDVEENPGPHKHATDLVPVYDLKVTHTTHTAPTLTWKNPESEFTSSESNAVLLVTDQYVSSKEDISTINRELVQILTAAGRKVYGLVLEDTEEDRKCAEADGVELILPTRSEGDTRKPSLDWLTFDHRARYPILPQVVGWIVGHAAFTSSAATAIKELRFPQASLSLVIKTIPENTEKYKEKEKAMGIGRKEDSIRQDAAKADTVFSVGHHVHDHFTNTFRAIPEDVRPTHNLFLPEPLDMFQKTTVQYRETKEKVVLLVSKVKEVEKQEGLDFVAKAISRVADRSHERIQLRIRGVSEEEYQASMNILQSSINSGKLIPTLLPQGTQEDICRDMQQAHLVLMPSRTEPFGLIGLEAMAAGVPVLISDQSGLATLVEEVIPEFHHSVLGITCDDSVDVRQWADQIEKVLRKSKVEFSRAAELKDRLLKSKYWEESHQQFLQACGCASTDALQPAQEQMSKSNPTVSPTEETNEVKEVLKLGDNTQHRGQLQKRKRDTGPTGETEESRKAFRKGQPIPRLPQEHLLYQPHTYNRSNVLDVLHLDDTNLKHDLHIPSPTQTEDSQDGLETNLQAIRQNTVRSSQEDVTVSWSRPSGDLSGYQLDIFDCKNNVQLDKSVCTKHTRYTFQGLVAGREYRIHFECRRTTHNYKIRYQNISSESMPATELYSQGNTQVKIENKAANAKYRIEIALIAKVTNHDKIESEIESEFVEVTYRTMSWMKNVARYVAAGLIQLTIIAIVLTSLGSFVGTYFGNCVGTDDTDRRSVDEYPTIATNSTPTAGTETPAPSAQNCLLEKAWTPFQTFISMLIIWVIVSIFTFVCWICLYKLKVRVKTFKSDEEARVQGVQRTFVKAREIPNDLPDEEISKYLHFAPGDISEDDSNETTHLLLAND